MNRDRHDQSALNDFETQLRSLVPRPPQAVAPMFEEANEPNQVARGRRWWSTNSETSRAFYRAIGLSASFGALFGAACTLLILRWSEVPDPNAVPPIAALSNEAAIASEGKQESVVEPDGDSSIVQVELPPENPRLLMSGNSVFPHDWLDNLRNLEPGTLEVGSRLVSRQVNRLHGTRNETQIVSARISSDAPSEIVVEASGNGSRIELGSRPLPQRQWMRQMLNSPHEFF
ncbi:MAG: hypothetical protein KDA72_02475 [Planctomycetales bacterium]|nr:hypothetical protein [Planctomycetales bacterium]